METALQVVEVPAEAQADAMLPVEDAVPVNGPEVPAPGTVVADTKDDAPQEVPMAVDDAAAAAVAPAPEVAVAVATATVAPAAAVPTPAPASDAAASEQEDKTAEPPADSDVGGTIRGVTAAIRRQKRATRRRAATVAAAAISAAAAAPKRKRLMSGRFLDKIIKSRRAKGSFYHSRLFKCERADIINADGDIRHFGCVAVSQIGPYAPGERIEVIDWLGSANLLFVSQTGKIADTIVLPLSGGSIEAQTPIEP